MSHSIWITWERQRRNRSMAARTGATLHELEFNGGRLARYWNLGNRTIALIRRSEPKVIFFQNPSLVLAALIATLKFLRLTQAKLVGDFHNAGVSPPSGKFLVPWVVKNSELTIVSNANLSAPIERCGGRAIAIPDPIPDFHISSPKPLESPSFDVLFVCSWAADEPIVEVLQAAKIISQRDPRIRVLITGRPKLEKVGWRETVPPNVQLTGFLSEADFEARLHESAAVLDLTTRADCMVCGAYEAVSVETPAILSDNDPSRRYFDQGVLFTDNTAADIARCVLEMKSRHRELSTDIRALKVKLKQQEETAFADLRRLLQ